jgi:hypothetical protein
LSSQQGFAYIAHMKRVERRGAMRIAVSVLTQQHVEGQSHCCVASNLSLSGVFIHRPIASFVRHSTTVELELSLPDGAGTPLRVHAEIVYDCFDAELHGSALRFVEMSAQDRARLTAFLERGSGGTDPSRAQAA